MDTREGKTNFSPILEKKILIIFLKKFSTMTLSKKGTEKKTNILKIHRKKNQRIGPLPLKYTFGVNADT